MPKLSAGILLHRSNGNREVFLVHPGGPFWAKKDEAAWSIPKGLVDADEDTLAAARREFLEETGFAVDGDFVPLGEFRQPGAKVVIAWALEGDADPVELKSNLFEMEWPPRSGMKRQFPEVDRAAWFSLDEAGEKIHAGQRPILEALKRTLAELNGQ
ncbi:MAG TPA: NUDIX domain-containing protein [Rhizobiaceae bacterium]|nr:NUDIX domain-containing protein [Rhizobiaceae bacterium]